MRLVEAVFGELLHEVEDLIGRGVGDLVLPRALHKALALLGHLLGLFLAHGAAQEVALAQRIVADDPGRAHDLFLVHDDAVRGLERLLQAEVRVADLDLAVLALDELVDHARTQGAGAVQREHGDDVLEAGGLEHAQVLAHAAALHLEDAVGVAAAENLVGLGIGQGQRVQVRGLFALAPDDVQGVLHHGHGAQAQEVELDQADLLDQLHVVLGDYFALFPPVQRQVVQHGPVGDDDARRVGRGVAREALQAP